MLHHYLNSACRARRAAAASWSKLDEICKQQTLIKHEFTQIPVLAPPTKRGKQSQTLQGEAKLLLRTAFCVSRSLSLYCHASYAEASLYTRVGSNQHSCNTVTCGLQAFALQQRDDTLLTFLQKPMSHSAKELTIQDDGSAPLAH